jgi:hypothetical protein
MRFDRLPPTFQWYAATVAYYFTAYLVSSIPEIVVSGIACLRGFVYTSGYE